MLALREDTVTRRRYVHEASSNHSLPQCTAACEEGTRYSYNRRTSTRVEFRLIRRVGPTKAAYTDIYIFYLLFVWRDMLIAKGTYGENTGS